MSKVYVIRKMAYIYDDNYFEVHTLGGIEGIYHSEDEAKKEFIRLEREALEAIDLGYTEQFSGSSNEYFKEVIEFKKYYYTRFKDDFVKIGYYGNAYCEKGTFLPKGLSDYDILNIRRILNLKFYELAVFSDSPNFYGIWLTDKKDFFGYFDVPLFYNTYSDALKGAKERIIELLKSKKIDGSIESLSNSPILLKSLINTSDQIDYDKENKKIILKYLQRKDALALNELLIDKAFEIKEIPLHEVENIDHSIYEAN